MTNLKTKMLNACCIAILATAGQAIAQEEPITTSEVSDDDTLRQDRVVVTGSRIRRGNADSAVPLQTFGAADLSEIGTTDLAEALTQLPGVSDAISPSNSNTNIQSSGLSTISLRRLGDDRTLVLINGKRAVSNSGNSDRVSLSTLPVGFIERTEVTTGGASAVYGSDAIAGVANFLLEDDFEGIELDLRYSAPEASGGDEVRANFSVGQNFADDKGYVLFSASYRDLEIIRADDTRPKSIAALEFDDPATGSNDTFANEINAPGCDPANEDRHCFLGSRSSVTPGGVFEGGDAWFVDGQWFNDQSLQPANRTGSQDFFGDFDGFNFRPGRTLEGAREIFNAAVHSTYDFSPDLTGSFTAMYSDIFSLTAGGFEGLSDDDSFGLLEAFEVGNIASDHPFIPAEVEETRSGSVSFDRRLVELGEQSRNNDRETIRLMADLDGKFAEEYDWNLYATFGEFEQDQVNPGEVNFLNAQFALDIEEDGNGGFQCVDADARAAGCVPLNLFGEGSISPEAADYIRYVGNGSQTRTQYTAGGYITGPVFSVPAGDVQMVGGLEFRREEQDTQGDPDGSDGGLDGDPNTADSFVTSLATFPSVSSDYDVIEAFAEIDVPIITDKLNFQSAIRFGDYSTVGTIFSYNVGWVWTPIEDIRFRAQYSQSQRAPNLTELFSPARPDSDDLRDPCDGLNPDGSGLAQPDGAGGENADIAVLRVNCLSEVGIQAFFADPENVGEPFEFDGSIQGPNTGNLDLQEETAETITAGVVLQPRAIPNLTVVADYYRIEIEDAITSISTQDTVDLCYSAADFPNNDFCGLVTRNPFNGEVVEVLNPQQNLNQELVSGIDVSLLYTIEPEQIPGEFDFDIRYSHYLDQEVSFTGIGGVELTTSPLGEIEDPEDEWRGRIRYSLGGFRATYTVTYLGGGVDDLLNDPSPSDDRFFETEARDYHNLFLAYDFGDEEQFRIYGGVNNIFDDLGPLIPTGLDTGSSLNIVSDLNDPVGREFYIGTRLRF